MYTIDINNFRTITPKFLAENKCEVIFSYNYWTLSYEVTPSHLSIQCSFRPDSEIFDRLQIRPYEFCDKVYGYECDSIYSFPHCKKNDYNALCNVIVALFEEIEKKNGVCSAVCKSKDKLSFFQKLIFLNK